LDSYFSFLNMHPRGYPTDDGDMTIRWAYKTDTLKSFNPVYSEWLWEWNTLGLIYDSLLVRNPYSLLQLVPWLCADYDTDIYAHPVFGNTTKVSFTLRPDVHFSDGTPLTTADIYFTWVELADMVIARGLPPPWWYSSVAHILSFTIYDAYNFECLLDVKSVYATMWIGGMVILPKHIWYPMAEGTSGDVQAAAADPNMIGPGPWRFVEYVANSHVLMTANEPGSTVTTNHAGSSSVTSPTGYVRGFPGIMNFYVTDPVTHAMRSKLEYGVDSTIVGTFTNLWDNETQVDTEVWVNGTQVYTDSELVPFMTDAHYVDIHATIIGIDWGFSWIHWTDLPGPMGTWTFYKQLNFVVLTYVDITVDGVIVDSAGAGAIIKLEVYWHMRTFDYPYPTSTYVMKDYELSWHTLVTDISGSTWYDQVDANIRGELIAGGLYAYDFAAYPHKIQLPTPDIKVDIKDVALAAKGFGAYPGHGRWSAVADINGDYKIDIKDIAGIAKDFGWVG
jgi:hypothetical protein